MCAAVRCLWEDCGDRALPVFWRLLHHLLQIQPWLSLFGLLRWCLLGIGLRIVFQHHFYFLWFCCKQIKKRLTESKFLLILFMDKMLAVEKVKSNQKEKCVIVYSAVEMYLPISGPATAFHWDYSKFGLWSCNLKNSIFMFLAILW